MIETQKEQERALLVGVELQQTDNFDMSMEELASLAKTAGALVKGVYTQKREKYDSKTFVGSGKLEEIAQMVEADEIDTVIDQVKASWSLTDEAFVTRFTTSNANSKRWRKTERLSVNAAYNQASSKSV